MARLTTIGFDADDTLWHNETVFRLTEERFAALLADHSAPQDLSERLHAAEIRNLGRYGFGVKGFVLSMIETALDVTGDRVPGPVIRALIEAGQEMLAHPVELLPHARAAVRAATEGHRVILITKGDLLDQERKLAASGLGDLFHGVEIVSDKTPEVYARVFARHGTGAAEALMVGNSLRSDVLPAIEAGGWGVWVPHDLTWTYERAAPPETRARYRELPHLGRLPDLLARIAAA